MRIAFSFASLLIVVIGRAQFTPVEDSLEVLLPRLHGTEWVDACNTIAEENVYSDLSKLDRYADRADSLAQTLPYREGSLRAQINKSFALYWRGQIAEANARFIKQHAEAEQLKFVDGIHRSLEGVSITYFRLNQLDQYLATIQAGLKKAEALPDQQLKVQYTILWNQALGAYYVYRGQLAKGREVRNTNLAFAKEHHADHRLLGICLKNLGEIEIVEHHLSKAEPYLRDALAHFVHARDRHLYMSTLVLLATVYADQGQTAKAIAIYEDVASDTEKRGYKIGMADAYSDLSDLFIAQGKFARAIALQLKAIDIYRELNRLSNLMNARKALGETYMKLRNYPLAINNLKDVIFLSTQKGASGTNDVLLESFILLSEASLELNDAREAKGFARAAVALAGKSEVATDSVSALLAYAKVHLKLHETDSATALLTFLKKHLPNVELRREVALYYILEGELLARRHDYTKSEQAFRKALGLSHNSNFAEIQANALAGLYTISKVQNHPKEALTYFESLKTIQDSIYSVAASNEITEIIAQYQTSEKEKENIALKNKQLMQSAALRTQGITLLMVSTVLVITTLFVAFLVRANRINKRNSQELYNKNQEIALQNEEIKAQNEEITAQKEALSAQHTKLEQSLQDLKYTQAVLIHSEKMASLGQLTAGIAHEINNPVNFISNGVEGLSQEIETLIAVVNHYEGVAQDLPADKLEAVNALKKKLGFSSTLTDIKELTKTIQTGVERTSHIVRSLRTFSHEGQQAFSRVNLNEQLDATLIMTQSEMKGRIELVKAYDPNLPLVECRIGEINQVFMNLVMNATQAIAENGKIEIKTQSSTDGKSVSVTISDTGQGMSGDVLSRIFEPFFTTKEVGKGTGLGLAISNSIIEKHGGKITVQSVPGHGTTFTIMLPVWQPNVPQTA
ncbi:ATP-binding protein [Chryseolinea lacunae]|uniref:histidine kinase n=1 Tax=Chryseolinea lacunae TaxID=2801331 RepID=A0ABS1KVV9_9BACT|nr:ATP-binding protein [Chryseolinea lacunae]MBL0743609.1 tetratricopeptide repeat protein [Chryseolinea lacunae]